MGPGEETPWQVMKPFLHAQFGTLSRPGLGETMQMRFCNVESSKLPCKTGLPIRSFESLTERLLNVAGTQQLCKLGTCQKKEGIGSTQLDLLLVFHLNAPAASVTENCELCLAHKMRS